MFPSRLFLAVSSLNFLRSFLVSSCAENCTDPPRFSPPRLVVRFGDPVSADCTVCQHACLNNLFGLEKSLGENIINGTRISWRVDRMTEWGTSPLCFYNHDAGQCCSSLPVTVYQAPTNVSVSFVNLTGPMVEGRLYTLQCSVRDVAPVQSLIVTFFEGQTSKNRSYSRNNTERRPVTETFTHHVRVSKQHLGVQFWCEAELDLGPEGPEDRTMVASQNITAVVHYEPKLKGPSHPDPITLTVGENLRLNCSAEGNPEPAYTWTLPSAGGSPVTDSVLTVESVTTDHKGQYVCSVSNYMATVTVRFDVDVQAVYWHIILAMALAVAALVALFSITVYMKHYRHNRMGQYNLKPVFRSNKLL